MEYPQYSLERSPTGLLLLIAWSSTSFCFLQAHLLLCLMHLCSRTRRKSCLPFHFWICRQVIPLPPLSHLFAWFKSPVSGNQNCSWRNTCPSPCFWCFCFEVFPSVASWRRLVRICRNRRVGAGSGSLAACLVPVSGAPSNDWGHPARWWWIGTSLLRLISAGGIPALLCHCGRGIVSSHVCRSYMQNPTV